MERAEAISEWTFRSNHIKKWLDEYGEEPSIRHYVELIDMAIEALSNQQKWIDEELQNYLIENADLVTCKDCKHYEFADNRAFGMPTKRCEWTGFEDVDDNDFCSRAERREE